MEWVRKMGSTRTNRMADHGVGTRAARVLGGSLVTIGTAGWCIWISWRVSHVQLHPLSVSLLALEIAGVLGGCLIALALLIARASSAAPNADVDHPCHRADPLSFPSVLAERLGHHLDSGNAGVGDTARILFDRRTPLAERAMAVARLDGLRRLMIVLSVAASLLIGSAPFGRLSVVPLQAAAVGLGATGLGMTVMSNGRIAVGARLRWSFSAMGLLVGRSEDGRAEGRSGIDPTESVPRSWIGVMATIVVLNLSLALRGLSDRWTHGLPPMEYAERGVVMAAGLMCVFAAMITLGRLPAPAAVDRHLVARRIEEGTARQSALVATALIGAVGFAAGVLPGAAAASDSGSGGTGVQRAGIESIVDVDDRDAVLRRFADEGRIEVTTHASNYD